MTHTEQDASIAGPSSAKSPRVENSLLESLSASLKEKINSEIKNLFVESQKEMLGLLKPKTGENVRENGNEEPENETRGPYTLTKSVRINSTHNDDPSTCRNNILKLQQITNINLGLDLGFAGWRKRPHVHLL